MARLFKPFTQLDASLNKHHEGTGLGLALVSRLTEMHGGSVSVESEPGRGSRFTVSLPWVDPPHTAASGEAASEKDFTPLQLQSTKLNRVLLIEDSPSAAWQIARYLEDLDIKIVIVPTGDLAISQAIELKPDVIFLDILLPDISGWDVLTALKAHPETRHIPVIIISNVDDQPRGLNLGAAAYLVKPVNRKELKNVLSNIFAAETPPAAKAMVVSPMPELAPQKDQPLILLAEDNPDSSMMMAEYLSIKGYRVVIARNGAEAIERARETTPMLILMDIQMPGMDGLEATRRLRADSDLAAIPIIALTALAMPGDRERCLEAGASDYMSKPVSLKKLIQIIEIYRH